MTRDILLTWSSFRALFYPVSDRRLKIWTGPYGTCYLRYLRSSKQSKPPEQFRASGVKKRGRDKDSGWKITRQSKKILILLWFFSYYIDHFVYIESLTDSREERRVASFSQVSLNDLPSARTVSAIFRRSNGDWNTFLRSNSSSVFCFHCFQRRIRASYTIRIYFKRILTPFFKILFIEPQLLQKQDVFLLLPNIVCY